MSDQPDRTTKLLTLMRDHDLTCQDVARMIDRQIGTVYQWRNGTYLVIPQTVLDLLELRAADRNRRRA